MGKKLNKLRNNFFFIDINTTTECNLRCKYCIEPFKENKDLKEETIDVFINRLEELFNTTFMKQYDGVTLGFWGGEPTLNPKAMTKLIEHYANDDRVKFLVYSNGYKINHIKPLIEKFKDIKIDNHPKVFYQISYDGKAAHNFNRVSKTGKATVDEVRESIHWAIKENIPFSIKSTINRETFHLMDECYEDIRELLGEKDTTYFPTIDYLTNIKITEEDKKRYYKDLEKSLVNIAAKEIEFYKKHKRFFFSWFNKGKALCGAGSHGLAMDTDGTVYKCHGTFYSDHKEDNRVTSIYRDTFTDDIEKSCNMHKGIFGIMPEECTNCYSEFCLRCNSMCYEISKKETFSEKWNDYTNQPEICELYKLATQVKWGVIKTMGLKG